jgi:hypothetical protein
MPVDDDPSLSLDVSTLTEITHETMMERWRLGLVTPMSATISTFAKTDGTWWTAAQTAWQRITPIEDNQRLDCHHDRFRANDQRSGAATSAPASVWDKRPPQSLFRPPPAREPGRSSHQ